MISLASEKCCGCTACVSICPKKCLEMVDDGEGFLIPKLTHEEDCIKCNMCNKACPVLNNEKELKKEQQGFIVQNMDQKVRQESTSGGAFTAIAKTTIANGGAVYGVAYGEGFKVMHMCVNEEKELWRFRNSKYVQSYLGDTFSKVKEQLDNSTLVCFSGTPCQIEGLRSYLRKDYQNLILVDVVCHGISSPLIWEKYLELNENNLPEQIFFRWKHYGYKYSTMSFFNKEKEVYYGGVESDPMLRAYFTNSCDRMTCYECPFKKRYRVSDITIWDCFQPNYFDKSFDDDKGTTSVLIHSDKGKAFFEKVLEMGTLKFKEVDVDELVFGNNEMIGSVTKGADRETLLKDAKVMPAKDLFNKYYPSSIKSKIKRFVRLSLLKIGVYKKVKYMLFLKRRKNAKDSNKHENI